MCEHSAPIDPTRYARSRRSCLRSGASEEAPSWWLGHHVQHPDRGTWVLDSFRRRSRQVPRERRASGLTGERALSSRAQLDKRAAQCVVTGLSAPPRWGCQAGGRRGASSLLGTVDFGAVSASGRRAEALHRRGIMRSQPNLQRRSALDSRLWPGLREQSGAWLAGRQLGFPRPCGHGWPRPASDYSATRHRTNPAAMPSSGPAQDESQAVGETGRVRSTAAAFGRSAAIRTSRNQAELLLAG